MNSKQRVYTMLAGEKTDRLPNTNIIMTYAAKEIGAKYVDFCTKPDVMTEGNIVCANKYGLDLLTVMSDPMTEAHDLGTEVIFPEDGIPYPKVNLLENEATLASLKIVKPENGKRMSERLETIRMYKDKVGDDFPIVGWVEGCFAESADLRGVNNFLMDTAMEEDFVTDLLDFCLEQAIIFAKAQIEAGADFIGVGDAISSVAGPKVYEKYARKYQEALLKAIKEAGAKTKLHICGNIQPFLEQLPHDYIDILDVDWMVSLEKAVEVIPEHIMLSGNYDPVAVVQDMTPEQIQAEVRRCAKIAEGRRYATSAGCEIPKATPEENFLCIKDAF